MIRTTALGSVYLLLLFAFAVGIKSLAGNNCSDWLERCPDAVTTTLKPPDRAFRPSLPDEPELH